MHNKFLLANKCILILILILITRCPSACKESGWAIVQVIKLGGFFISSLPGTLSSLWAGVMMAMHCEKERGTAGVPVLEWRILHTGQAYATFRKKNCVEVTVWNIYNVIIALQDPWHIFFLLCFYTIHFFIYNFKEVRPGRWVGCARSWARSTWSAKVLKYHKDNFNIELRHIMNKDLLTILSDQ